MAAWVKPYAVFRPNVWPAYAWEPVLFRGGRGADRTRDTPRDWFSQGTAATPRGAGTFGKPLGFGCWVADILGATTEDHLIDIFPGTGAVSASWHQMALALKVRS